MTKIYAHRGASANAPENTMDAFYLAEKSGAYGIELDIHLTKDSRMVVCHDYSINRTTFATGFIKDMTYDEIKDIRAGKSFKDPDKFLNARIPLFEEVVDFVKNTDMALNVELKASSAVYFGIEEKVINLLKENNMLEKSMISSFDHRALSNVKKINKDIPVGILYEAYLLDVWKYVKEYGFDYIHPHFLSVDKELVDSCHENNVDVNCWTVNDINTAEMLMALGCDILISDCPDKLMSLIGE